MFDPRTHIGYKTLVLSRRIREFFRDTTYRGIPRTYAIPGPRDADFIEYIPAPSVPEPHTCTYYLCCR